MKKKILFVVAIILLPISANAKEPFIFECIFDAGSHMIFEHKKNVVVDEKGETLNAKFYLKIDDKGAYKKNPMTEYNPWGKWVSVFAFRRKNSTVFIEELDKPVGGFQSNGVMMISIFDNGFMLADKHISTFTSRNINHKTGWRGNCKIVKNIK